jgi:hypothetical protein
MARRKWPIFVGTHPVRLLVMPGKAEGFAALQPKSRGDEGTFRKLPVAAFSETQSLLSSLHHQASLTGIALLALFLQKLGKANNHQRSASLKLLEEAFGELGRIIPVFTARRSAKLRHERIGRYPDAPRTQLARAAGFRADPGRRSLPAFHPAPAFPSGTVFQDRRSHTDRGPAPFGSRTLSNTSCARWGLNVPALNRRPSNF